MRTVIMYVVALSLLAAYPLAYELVPVSLPFPGRPVTIEGVVVDKYISERGNVTLQTGIWYGVAVRLACPDPVNRVSSGGTFAYIVSKDDFEN